MANEHPGLEIISFEEFLNREVMTGHIRDKQTGQPLFPPNNRTDWNGVARQDAKQLDAFSRKLGYSSPWNFDQCMAGFAEKPNDAQGEQRLDKMAINVTAIVQGKRMNEMFINKPVPVDASPVERLMENLAHRNRLCVYTPELQKEKVFHLMGDNASNARLLVHFYAFLFFENWKQDLWTKVNALHCIIVLCTAKKLFLNSSFRGLSEITCDILTRFSALLLVLFMACEKFQKRMAMVESLIPFI